jgi:signal transduction histidine kinase
MLFNIILAFSGIILFILALVVLYSNSRARTNQWLSGFMASGLLWLVANLLTNTTHNNINELLFARLTLIGATLIPLTFLFFCYSFTDRLKNLSLVKYCLYLLPIAVLLGTTPTTWNVKSIAVSATSFQPGISYLLLLIILVTYFWKGISLLVSDYRVAKQPRRRQLYYILIGVGLTAIPGIFLNGLLPLLGLSQAAAYGSVVVIFFSIFTSIAIVRHHLLDIRLIVARSIAYLMSLAVLAAVYGFLVFGASNLIFHLHFPVGVQIFIAAATAVASLSFASIKSFFDRTTNRLFFRDAYDTQVFLDEFNKTLVVTHELDELLKESAKIIEENIKPAHCLFAVNATANTKSRLLGYGNRGAITKEDMREIRDAIGQTRQKLIVADELEDNHEALQKLLRGKDIVIVARLAASSSGAKSDVGYLMLGPKKSGNLYSSQDLKVIEIVANELVIAVQNALQFEEIENFNITLQGKVDEATRKLRRANERLKTLDETKDDFISMASHQLRTPLTSVKGYISMVLEGDAGKLKPTQKKLLTQSFFGSQRMVYLIADLLNVSRLKTGKFIIESVPVNLAEVVEEELEQLKETAMVRTLKLSYKKPKYFPELMLDDTKTRQVIMNFLDNAIYYTPSGGHITVRLVDNPTTVELRVEDDGIGVSKSEQPHLFTKFYRAGNARKARPDGTGLGLFMAKKVVIAQGGAIIFESQQGKGSTFGFVFSKAKLAVPVKLPAQA